MRRQRDATGRTSGRGASRRCCRVHASDDHGGSSATPPRAPCRTMRSGSGKAKRRSIRFTEHLTGDGPTVFEHAFLPLKSTATSTGASAQREHQQSLGDARARALSSATAYTTDLATVRKIDLVARALGNRTAMSGSVHPGLFDWFARCPLWPQQPPWKQTCPETHGSKPGLPPWGPPSSCRHWSGRASVGQAAQFCLGLAAVPASPVAASWPWRAPPRALERCSQLRAATGRWVDAATAGQCAVNSI